MGCHLRNLKKNVKGIPGKLKLTNAMIDRLQNCYGKAIRQSKNDLKKMQAAVKATFYVASSKENNWHYPHCREGKDSWSKFQDRANGTGTYKSGPSLPLDIVMKSKPIL